MKAREHLLAAIHPRLPIEGELPSLGSDNALIRLVHDRERYLVDLRGTRYLATLFD